MTSENRFRSALTRAAWLATALLAVTALTFVTPPPRDSSV